MAEYDLIPLDDNIAFHSYFNCPPYEEICGENVYNFCPYNCNDNGVCINGKCECLSGMSENYCAYSIIQSDGVV